MGKKKSEKYNQVIKLLLQDVPTHEIAKITGYSLYYIRDILKELREEYGVNTTKGLAVAYLSEQITKIAGTLNELVKIITPDSTPNFRCDAKRRR